MAKDCSTTKISTYYQYIYAKHHDLPVDEILDVLVIELETVVCVVTIVRSVNRSLLDEVSV
jgi:hypothetical protein